MQSSMTPSLQTAAIYSRYSTGSQRPSSIVDQQRRCQEYADRNQLQVVAKFADEAEKGWDRTRGQYQAMLAAAKRGEFKVLLIDDLSRAFRDTGEQSFALRRLAIWGIRVIALADGLDTMQRGAKLIAGLKGIVNETFLDTVAEMTQRGLEGRALEGMSTGGAVYGYRTEPVFVRISANVTGHFGHRDRRR